MKKIVLLLSLFVAAPFLMPTTAEARHGNQQRIISYRSCGAPVYQVYQFIGYDYCGQPMYRSYTRTNCRCGSHYHQPQFHHPHHSYCPPSPRYHHSRSRSSFSFFWSH